MIRIYEVMAIENGLPLFFTEHIKRLQASISDLQSISMKELTEIATNSIAPLLVDKSGYNIKITYSKGQFSVQKRESRKPSSREYISGGVVGIFDAQRFNPLIKQENASLREQAEAFCTKHNLYDVLLRNKLGYVTEGSRSNFLLIDNRDRIITSPIGESLNGITREKIFEICRELKFPIIEEQINLKILEEARSLIITGTSPEILPIKQCETLRFDVTNPVISKLQRRFAQSKIIDRELTKKYFISN